MGYYELQYCFHSLLNINILFIENNEKENQFSAAFKILELQ
jgi:hypothetical protein